MEFAMFARSGFKDKVNKPRDGRHCDLCGCSFPAVRCDKCSSQVFCLSCDDMYHRHPKRKFHLRKAVDPIPTPQARPVLPMKASNLPLAPGDPSKMPLPPPRKKKPGRSIFDTFRRGSPSSDASPTFSKKDYSWSNRLGSIKKFMSNRPLPPVPDNEKEQPLPEENTLPNHNMSFIHKRVEEKPPALPERSQPRGSLNQMNTGNSTDISNQAHLNGMNHNSMMLINGNVSSVESSGQKMEEIPQWQLPYLQNAQQRNLNNVNIQRFNTLQRQGQMQDLSSPSSMHQSSSASDLTSLSDMSPIAGMQSYLQYPYNPHMAPHFPHPYPMFPQYQPYPSYFGSSWANLATPPHATDGDFSDQSETPSSSYVRGRHDMKDKKAKRSQSVLVDRMAFPSQFYPFGPFPPGYPAPWIPGLGNEAPPSPAVSHRSLSRSSHSHRRRKKVTDDEDYEDYSSSPISRPKSSSSEMSKTRMLVKSKSCPSSSSSDDEIERISHAKSRRSPSQDRKFNRQNFRHKSASPRQSPVCKKSSRDDMRLSERAKKTSKGKNKGDRDAEESNRQLHNVVDNLEKLPLNDKSESYSSDNAGKVAKWVPATPWRCKHCTYVNNAGERICQVCCRTATKSVSPVEDVQNNSTDSPMSGNASLCTKHNPEKEAETTDHHSDQHEMAVLNSALDEAQKEINRSLDELLKVQNESIITNKQEITNVTAASSHTASEISLHLQNKGNMTTVMNDNSQSVNINPSTTVTEPAINQFQLHSKNSIPSVFLPSPLTNGSLSYTPAFGYRSNAEPNTVSAGIQLEMQGNKDYVHNSAKSTEACKDSSCQTYSSGIIPNNNNADFASTNTADMRQNSDYRYPFDEIGNRHAGMSYRDHVPFPHTQGFRNEHGLMYRSHSRASLFGGRLSDRAPAFEYGTGAAGLSPAPVRRSISRTSLMGDTESWAPDYPRNHKPKFYLSMEELVERRRQETMRSQGLELVRMIREAEQQGFIADDIQVALNNCGKQNPLEWLQDNWKNIIRTVVTLATNYGKDKNENDVGVISENEARDALRLHKGNIWAAVTECVEGRQRKFLELSARGNFTFKEIVNALTESEGDGEIAYSKLAKTNLKPFLMRIWGSGEGMSNLEGAAPNLQELELAHHTKPGSKVGEGFGENGRDNSWDEGSYEADDVDWKDEDIVSNDDDEYYEEEEEEEEQVNVDKVTMGPESTLSSEKLATPESERSEYCDAWATGDSGERCMSVTSVDEIYFVGSDLDDGGEQLTKKESQKKKGGLLSKLMALRKGEDSSKSKKSGIDDDKSDVNAENAKKYDSDVINIKQIVHNDVRYNLELNERTDSSSNFSPFNILKQTLTAIKDAVTVPNTKPKNFTVSDKRTIVVHDRIGHESSSTETLSSPAVLPKPTDVAVSSKAGSLEIPGKKLSSLDSSSSENDVHKGHFFAITPATIIVPKELKSSLEDVCQIQNSSLIDENRAGKFDFVQSNEGNTTDNSEKIREGHFKGSITKVDQNHCNLPYLENENSLDMIRYTVENNAKIEAVSPSPPQSGKVTEQMQILKEVKCESQTYAKFQVPYTIGDEVDDRSISLALPESVSVKIDPVHNMDVVDRLAGYVNDKCVSQKLYKGVSENKIKIGEENISYIDSDDDGVPSNSVINQPELSVSTNLKNVNESLNVYVNPIESRVSDTLHNTQTSSVEPKIAKYDVSQLVLSKNKQTTHECVLKVNNGITEDQFASNSLEASFPVADYSTESKAETFTAEKSLVQPLATNFSSKIGQENVVEYSSGKDISSACIKTEFAQSFSNAVTPCRKEIAGDLFIEPFSSSLRESLTNSSMFSDGNMKTLTTEPHISLQLFSLVQGSQSAPAGDESIKSLEKQTAKFNSTIVKPTSSSSNVFEHKLYKNDSYVENISSMEKSDMQRKLIQGTGHTKSSKGSDLDFSSKLLKSKDKTHSPLSVSLHEEKCLVDGQRQTTSDQNSTGHLKDISNNTDVETFRNKESDIVVKTEMLRNSSNKSCASTNQLKSGSIGHENKLESFNFSVKELKPAFTPHEHDSLKSANSLNSEVSESQVKNTVKTDNTERQNTEYIAGISQAALQTNQVVDEAKSSQSERTDFMQSNGGQKIAFMDTTEPDNSDTREVTADNNITEANSLTVSLVEGDSDDDDDFGSEEEVSLSSDVLTPKFNSVRPAGPLRRMSFNTRKQAIFLERNKSNSMNRVGESKPWFLPKKVEPVKPVIPKRSIKQQLEFERRVRNLVSEKKCRTYRKAEIVVQLLDLNFEESEAIYAATECSTLEQAVSFLQQECLLCAGKYPVAEIISMVHCPHKACKECIKAYFTIQIRDRTIMELLCPFCNEPDITDEDVAQDYFNHLDIMLKKLVSSEIHELFQRKLRDRVLMRDPNFRWCSQCSSGFIAEPNLRRLMCPDCNAITCAKCRRLWEREHEGVSCEAFAAWKDLHDSEAQTYSLAKLLTEDGIDCPSCHFRYALAKGGCMHFKCIQCHHDFCSGCTRPFKMGQKCGISEFCVKLGLHAHHPRNCLFYLRDKEPEDLQRLLDMNGLKFNKEKPQDLVDQRVCQVLEQKETSQGMVDDVCGKDVQDGYAGLCRVHYVEYLGQLVNKHKVDPIQIFDNDDLELVLKRASIRLPPKKYRESAEEYRDKLVQLIEERLPLGEVEAS